MSVDLEEERRLTALLFGTTTSTTATSGSSLPIAGVDSDAAGRDASRGGRVDLLPYGISSRKSQIPIQGTRTKEDGDESDDDTLSRRPLFEIDRAGESRVVQALDDQSRKLDPQVHKNVSGASDDDDEDDDRSNDPMDRHQTPQAAAPAWEDDDDEKVQVNLMESSLRLRKLRTSRSEEVSALPGRDLEARLRSRFQSTAELTARTDWARVDDRAAAEDDGEGDTNSAQEYSALSLFGGPGIGRKLPGGAINMVRCRDANQSDPNQSVVQAVHFHPASDAANPLLLTAGLDKTLRFFQVDVEKSTKVHGIHCTFALVLAFCCAAVPCSRSRSRTHQFQSFPYTLRPS
jgi:hypothetical protein